MNRILLKESLLNMGHQTGPCHWVQGCFLAFAEPLRVLKARMVLGVFIWVSCPADNVAQTIGLVLVLDYCKGPCPLASQG